MTQQPGNQPRPETRSIQTFGESLRRARSTGATECPHGEPRGERYCALCRGVRSNTRSTWGR